MDSKASSCSLHHLFSFPFTDESPFLQQAADAPRPRIVAMRAKKAARTMVPQKRGHDSCNTWPKSTKTRGREIRNKTYTIHPQTEGFTFLQDTYFEDYFSFEFSIFGSFGSTTTGGEEAFVFADGSMTLRLFSTFGDTCAAGFTVFVFAEYSRWGCDMRRCGFSRSTARQ